MNRSAKKGIKGTWVASMFATDYYVTTYRAKMDEPALVLKDTQSVVELLGVKPPSHILDWCGGYGRFSIPLARLGFAVTNLDVSSVHTALAHKEARAAGVALQVITADFRYTPKIKADAAINLFTSGIGYLTKEDDLMALKSLYKALKPGAPFVLDTMSPGRIFGDFRPHSVEVSADGLWKRVQNRVYDPRRALLIDNEELYMGESLKASFTSKLRLYQPHELIELLEEAGFRVVDLYGDFVRSPWSVKSHRTVLLSERS